MSWDQCEYTLEKAKLWLLTITILIASLGTITDHYFKLT